MVSSRSFFVLNLMSKEVTGLRKKQNVNLPITFAFQGRCTGQGALPVAPEKFSCWLVCTCGVLMLAQRNRQPGRAFAVHESFVNPDGLKNWPLTNKNLPVCINFWVGLLCFFHKKNTERWLGWVSFWQIIEFEQLLNGWQPKMPDTSTYKCRCLYMSTAAI